MKKINSEDLLNLWLKKYHNITFEEVLDTHPEWKDNPREHTHDFYDTYQVTQAQEDEWIVEAKALIKKVTKCSNRMLEHDWPWIYLNTSPKVKKDGSNN